MKRLFGLRSSQGGDYLQQLSLRELPFTAELAGDYFYHEPAREQTVNLLLHLTQYSDELLLVAGEAGSGKSSLLEQYLARKDEHWTICNLNGVNASDPAQLFAAMAGCFHIETANTEAEHLLGVLRAHLNHLHEKSLPILAVDDAEQLSNDALEMLIHLAALEGEHGRLLRVVMLATPHLVSTLATERFTALPAPHVLKVEPLEEEQVASYLAHRMNVSGYQDESPFNDKQIKRIFKSSQGVPKAVNEAAHEVLLEITGLKSNTAKPMVIGAATAAVVLVVASSLWLGSDGATTPSDNVSEEPGLESAPRLAIELVADTTVDEGTTAPEGDIGTCENATDEQVSTAASSEEGCRPVSDLSDEPEGVAGTSDALQAVDVSAQHEEVSGSEELVAPAVNAVSEEAQQLFTPVVTSVKVNPLLAGAQGQRLVVYGEGFVPGVRVAVASGDERHIVPAEQVQLLDSQTISFDFVTGEEAKEWSLQVATLQGERSNIVRFVVEAPATEHRQAEQPSMVEAEAVPASSSAPRASAVSPTPEPITVAGAEWVRAQSPGNFTLQLMVSSEAARLREYARRASPPAPLAIFPTLRDGQRLYVMVQGSYASRAVAEQAVERLAVSEKPWIRAFADLSVASPAPGGQEAIVPAPSAATRDPAAMGDNATVWSRSPARHTLQIAAAENRQTLIKAAIASGLDTSAMYLVTSQREGKPWFLLLYGDWESREQARSAITTLPAAIRRNGPWSRSFASLHDELSRRP